ncbi:MAG: type II secretion system F family protein [Candidatus Nanohaloarchaea archaeon]
MKTPVSERGIYEKLPEAYRDRVEREARYASMDNHESIVLHGMVAVAAAILIGSMLLPYSLAWKVALLGLGLVTVPPLVPYVIVSIAAERRRKEMENVLPDALLLISANMKSGLNIEKAFLLSARDEFGPLAEELRTTAMQMFGGKPVEEALDDLEYRVKSGLFKETIKLLIDGLEAGGNSAELLESSADDIRNSMELREEINSNIRMYVIFIVMAAVIGAPLLFSISVYMSQTTAEMWAGTNIGDLQTGGQLGLTFQKPQVNTAFFEQFSVMAIIVINFFSALIISQIKNANVKEGAKYIPPMIAVSLILFFIIKGALASVMGGFS